LIRFVCENAALKFHRFGAGERYQTHQIGVKRSLNMVVVETSRHVTKYIGLRQRLECFVQQWAGNFGLPIVCCLLRIV